MSTILCFLFAWFCSEPLPRLHHQDGYVNQIAFEIRPQTISDLHHYRESINDELMSNIIYALHFMRELDPGCSKESVHYFTWKYITITCHEREMVRQILSQTLRVTEKRWGKGPFDESWHFCDLPKEEIKPTNYTQEFDTTKVCKDGGKRMWYLPEIVPGQTELEMLQHLLRRTMGVYDHQAQYAECL